MRARFESWLTVAAAVLLPLGIGLIVMGWYGAAHTPYLFEQIPYLISGGLLGLGLVMGAGLLYFASWIAKGAANAEQSSAEVAALLREIRDELALRSVEGSRPARKGKSAFVATARGSMWHRADCAAVLGREDLRTVPVDGGGLAPCALCDPLSSATSFAH